MLLQGGNVCNVRVAAVGKVEASAVLQPIDEKCVYLLNILIEIFFRTSCKVPCVQCHNEMEASVCVGCAMNRGVQGIFLGSRLVSPLGLG